MKIIEPKVGIMFLEAGDRANKFIELCGRTCYKSEHKITQNSANKFVRGLVKSSHHSVLEHSMLSVRFIIDRGVSHELVRHRLIAASQESTRYCNYTGDIAFVKPPFWETTSAEYGIWHKACIFSEAFYHDLIGKFDVKPEQARTVLNNSLKTEVIVTANYREWRHILELRCGPKAHPQIRQVMIPLGEYLFNWNQYVFDNDFYVEKKYWETEHPNGRLAEVTYENA